MKIRKYLYTLIVLAAALVSCRKTEAPSEISQGQLMLRVTNSLAIPNHEVEIEITGDQLVVIRQDQDKKAIESHNRLSPEELTLIWKFVDSINWKSVGKDDVLGLDGASYLIHFGELEYQVWTPEDDTDKRGLSSLLNLKSLLWRIAEIQTGDQVGAGNLLPYE